MIEEQNYKKKSELGKAAQLMKSGNYSEYTVTLAVRWKSPFISSMIKWVFLDKTEIYLLIAPHVLPGTLVEQITSQINTNRVIMDVHKTIINVDRKNYDCILFVHEKYLS